MNSQHRHAKGKSCLTNLIAVTDETAEQKAMDVIWLDFSTVVGTIFHSILIWKYGLDEQTVRWDKNGLWHLVQRLITNTVICDWQLATS